MSLVGVHEPRQGVFKLHIMASISVLAMPDEFVGAFVAYPFYTVLSPLCYHQFRAIYLILRQGRLNEQYLNSFL
jgi:hypothetical protein